MSRKKLKKIMTKLRKETFSELSPKACYLKVVEIIGGRVLISSINENIEPKRFFRLSTWMISDDESKTIKEDLSSKDFSYNPDPEIGRVNVKSQPVLYLSSDYTVTFHEVKLRPGQFAFLSIWKVDLKRLKFSEYTYGLGLKGAKLKNSFKDAIRKQILKIDTQEIEPEFLNEIYSKTFTSNHKGAYHISSSISNHDFKEENVDYIVYPSVAKKMEGINIALSKECSDDENITKIEKVLLIRYNKHSGNEVKMDIIKVLTPNHLKIDSRENDFDLDCEDYLETNHLDQMESLLEATYKSEDSLSESE